MKLRNANGDFNVGLDLGTNSVGWAVTDERGQLAYFKGEPTWGSRLFDAAETAASARIPRGQRRRYVRRRWRLDLLQSLFKEEVEKVDPDFFIRLSQSRLLKEDRREDRADYRWPLFNDSDFTEKDYYERFPTIYHLRRWLMETDEKADIRLVYLAVHNIVKHRGNFLRQEEKGLSAKNAKPEKALGDFRSALCSWCLTRDLEEPSWSDATAHDILKIMADEQGSGSDKKKAISALIGVKMDDPAAARKCNDALAALMVGLKGDLKNVFGEFPDNVTTSISLSNDEAVDAIRENCPDDSGELFDRLCNVYSAYVLQGLLSYAPGETISANMVRKYEKYGEDLRLLKSLVKEYAPGEYDAFFRGKTYRTSAGKDAYDVFKAEGYTRYNCGTSKMSYDDFAKAVEKLLGATPAANDKRYVKMMAEFEKEQFLRRLKTSDNGSIYYQLHLEELHAILENQGRFYSFLREDEGKIESLVSFRIPYYVGPLSLKNAATDKSGNNRFAWVERRPGMEDVVITPWNWEQVIDCGASAEKFIMRMTGKCTYLQGEDVLPKCSLLYEEFCVLNELNGAHWSPDGDEERRFDVGDRMGIIEDLFTRHRTVSYKRVSDWLEREQTFAGARVSGGQGESGFESKMSSYIFFCKDVFKTDRLSRSDYPMIEKIILWNTLFEDRGILREKVEEAYGDRLTPEQIKVICKKRFMGWGRLSRKFLEGLKVNIEGARVSIMDVMRGGSPVGGDKPRAMVLMEVLRDENLGFQKRVDDFNRRYFEVHDVLSDVNELPGSPAIRRSINQTIKIVDEVVAIAGHAPKNIFIEVTREDDPKKKGKRTRRRYEELKAALEQFKSEDPELWRELNERSTGELDERLTLYFMQRGRCLYSNRSIDINQLSSGVYEVDHIIPRTYVKDDSLENKALVYREENQRKTDAMLIDKSVRRKMAPYWRILHDAKLIGDKKFNNLRRSSIDDNAMRGFIARQLVETSQMVKAVQSLLEAKYPETNIIPVKAGVSHDLRDAAGLVKCREANDYHHAHDAFLACRVGLFIQKRHPGIYENPIGYAHLIRNYARAQSVAYGHGAANLGSSGFIINSFMSSGFDKETGEVFKDDWDAEAEIEGIRRTLNFRQCHITRMPYEENGAFWNATIYSPRDPKMGKKLSLQLKDGLDTQKYGGYSSEQYAYFFVYEARDKKGKRVFRFAQVPIWLASRIHQEEGALESYAAQLAREEKLEFVRIERAKILKKQLVEIDGDRFYITGRQEMRNARELAFSVDEMGLLLKVNGLKDASEEDASAALETVASRGLLSSNRLSKMINLSAIPSRAKFASVDEVCQLVINLLALFNAAANKVDLRVGGGGKFSGAIQPNYSKLLSDPNCGFYIIDQSTTGMFERRTRIGL